MFKRLLQDLIEIPVDQIIFILEIAVKCLTRSSTFLNNLFHCDLFHRHL